MGSSLRLPLVITNAANGAPQNSRWCSGVYGSMTPSVGLRGAMPSGSDVAQALLPAASALMPTLAFDTVSRPRTGVETSLDTAGKSACATSRRGRITMACRGPLSARAARSSTTQMSRAASRLRTITANGLSLRRLRARPPPLCLRDLAGERGTARRARIRLRMEAAVGGVVVLGAALRAHGEGRHGGVRPVVRDVADDGVPRAAVGAVGEGVPV